MTRGKLHWWRANGELGTSEVAYARSFWLRLRGLLGRPALATGEGILIAPCNAIHTLFMGFTIDVVFVGADHRVMALFEGVPPWRYRQCLKARYVVELAAGEIDRLGLEEGDKCQWQ